MAAGLGDGRLYWYWPTTAKKGSGDARPLAQWVEDAHASAVSAVAVEQGEGRCVYNLSATYNHA